MYRERGRRRTALALILHLDTTMNPLRSFRRTSMLTASSILFSSASIACGSDSPTQSSSPVAGAYVATVFRVTPAGEPTIDVLAQGGTLSITIAADNTTTGSLTLPASIAGTDLSLSMAGTAVVSGSTVTFQQLGDTFVRDLTFTVSGNTLSVANQLAGDATFTLTLTKQ
jgi:hypothetical protein